MANKVLFGLSNVYFGTYTVSSVGVVTLGTPYHQAGAVSFSPEESNDVNIFYADNTAYYTSYGAGSISGELEVAMFDDDFKTDFLGYVELDDGGLAQVKNASKPDIYMMFQVEGDQEGRRCIMYNGSLGSISREYSTTEESIEPVTETISVNFAGDNGTGITIVTYKESDAGYATLFTNPPVPALPSE